MSDGFDPYHKWLGIRAEDQPPNHYRLLGIDQFESDAEVIEIAADQRMAHLRTFQNGQRGKLSQRLLGEVSRAKICLLDPQKKSAYDHQLTANTNGGSATSGPPPLSDEPPVQARHEVRNSSPIDPPQASTSSDTSNVTTETASNGPSIAVADHSRQSYPAARHKHVSKSARSPSIHPLVFVGILGAVSIVIVGGAIGLLALLLPNNSGSSGDSEQLASNDSSDDDTSDTDNSRQDADDDQSNTANQGNNGNSSNDGNRGNGSRGNGNRGDQIGNDGNRSNGTRQGRGNHGGDDTNQQTNGNQTDGNDSDNNVNNTGDSTDTNNEQTSTSVNNVDSNSTTGNSNATSGLRLPIPDDDELTDILDSINETYDLADDLEKDQLSQIASSMLTAANDGADDLERYGLLWSAREAAHRAGTTTVAIDAITELVRDYQHESMDLTSASSKQLAPNLATEDDFVSFVKMTIEISRTSLLNDMAAPAMEAVNALEQDVPRPMRRPFQKEITDLRRLVEDVEEDLTQFTDAYAKYESGVASIEDQVRIGSWLCFSKQQWDVGVSHFADLNDGSLLAEVGQMEVAADPEAPPAMDLANKWWDVAESVDREWRMDCLRRAGYWYLHAMENSQSAVERDRIRVRLGELHRRQEYPAVHVPLARYNPVFVDSIRLEPVARIDADEFSIESIAISPDGFSLAVAASPNKLEIFDLISGQLRHQITNSNQRWLAMDYSSDGTMLVTGGASSDVVIWDTSNGNALNSYSANRGIMSLVVRADDRSILAVDGGNQVHAWAIGNANVTSSVQLHSDDINDIAMDRSGEVLVTASDDRTVGVFNDTRPRHQLTGHQAEVLAVDISADGDLIASGDRSGNLLIWNARTGTGMFELAHISEIRDVKFFPFSEFVASIDRDENLIIWRSTTGEKVIEMQVEGVDARQIEISPACNMMVISGGRDDVSTPLKVFKIAFE